MKKERHDTTDPSTIRRMVEERTGTRLSDRDNSSTPTTWRKLYAILAHRYTISPLQAMAREIGRNHATMIHHIRGQEYFERDYPIAREIYRDLVTELESMRPMGLEGPAQMVIREMERLTA